MLRTAFPLAASFAVPLGFPFGVPAPLAAADPPFVAVAPFAALIFFVSGPSSGTKKITRLLS